MKIHKILIGCSLFIAISFITGCSSKSNTTIGDIETTVISDDELNKNAHEISEGLPDNASVYSVPNMSEEIESSMRRVVEDKKIWQEKHIYLFHLILDKIVDKYFPAVHKIEDDINLLDLNLEKEAVRDLIDTVFDIRSDLLKLRKIITSKRDLVYRIINSEHLRDFKEKQIYFNDIYDHLLKLSEMVESSRDMTSDMRDSYVSMNSDRMNKIMMTFTVITSIFVPLTFITGIYGMNFENMPELKWTFGYYMVLGIMAVVALTLMLLFKKKGWFRP